MLTRAWFALSVLWFLLCCWSWNGNADGFLWFALLPFVIGIFLKFLFRYVVRGSFR